MGIGDRSRRLRIAAFAVFALLGVAVLVARHRTEVNAAPPVIGAATQQAHPYDPDWLEVRWILDTKCVGCHRPNTKRADLTTYDALMKAGHEEGMPAVVPGKPVESFLYDYVVWNVHAQVDSEFPDSPMMPEDRKEWLTAGQIETIKRWIANGAFEYQLPDTCEHRVPTEIDFPSAKQCSVCHPRQYDQWSRSMHAYAQHSPVFEAFNLTLVERTAGTIGTFCTRCHTPIGTSLGENESMRNIHRSRLSMEGVTCVACHRRKDGRYKASGRIRVEGGSLLEGCVYGPFDAPASEAVGGHRSTKDPYIKSSQFCAECHDVTSPEGFRLEEAFSEWNNSPAAKQGISCQHCHMGPIQGQPIPDSHRPLGRAAEVPGVDPSLLPLRHLSDHTFAGPDYSLLPDTEFPHKLDWMYEVDYRDPSQLTPYQQRTLQELRRANRESLAIAAAKRYELLQNAAEIEVRGPSAVRPGDSFHIDVDVTSKVAGHSFPTGFTAERQLWVSVELRDAAGNLVFESGTLDENGDLRDDHSHAVVTGHAPYDHHLLNFQNKFIALTNKGTERSVVLSVNRHLRPLNMLRPATDAAISFGRPGNLRIGKASLPPLRTIGNSYPVQLPDCSGTYWLTVRLNFRHLPPALLDHVGTPHLKPLLEIVVIDEVQTVIVASEGVTDIVPEKFASRRERRSLARLPGIAPPPGTGAKPAPSRTLTPSHFLGSDRKFGVPQRLPRVEEASLPPAGPGAPSQVPAPRQLPTYQGAKPVGQQSFGVRQPDLLSGRAGAFDARTAPLPPSLLGPATPVSVQAEPGVAQRVEQNSQPVEVRFRGTRPTEGFNVGGSEWPRWTKIQSDSGPQARGESPASNRGSHAGPLSRWVRAFVEGRKEAGTDVAGATREASSR